MYLSIIIAGNSDFRALVMNKNTSTIHTSRNIVCLFTRKFYKKHVLLKSHLIKYLNVIYALQLHRRLLSAHVVRANAQAELMFPADDDAATKTEARAQMPRRLHHGAVRLAVRPRRRGRDLPLRRNLLHHRVQHRAGHQETHHAQAHHSCEN